MRNGDLQTMNNDELMRNLVETIREVRTKLDVLALAVARLEQKAESITESIHETRETVGTHTEYIQRQKGGAHMLSIVLGLLGGLIPWIYNQIANHK